VEELEREFTMTRTEKLDDIRNNPQAHLRNFEDLIACLFVNNAIDSELLDAHPELGRNGGQKCDVVEGPCSCGGWH
jgi:hypothetical protein